MLMPEEETKLSYLKSTYFIGGSSGIFAGGKAWGA